MKIDTVFSGGGVRAFAFIGAIRSVEQEALQIERVAGTSAGAIIAALLNAGYNADELADILTELNLKKFLDPPFISKKIPLLKWISLYFKLGLYKGDAFEKWLASKLAEKGIKTFADVKHGHLKIIVSDISLGKLIILPDDLPGAYGISPTIFSVARAVRMSASFPFFFMPKKIIGNHDKVSYMLDGGLLSNFPLWIFEEDGRKRRPVLGISLSDAEVYNEPTEIKNALNMMQAMLSTMLRAHDTRYISKAKEPNIIFIPVENMKATNLKISNKEKAALIQLGQESANQFLKSWP